VNGRIRVAADGSTLTLQRALECAAANSAPVSVMPGTYSGNFYAPPGVQLIGSGADQTILDGQGLGRTLVVHEGCLNQGVTITGGAADNGGGILVDGPSGESPVIRQSRIVGNSASGDGGGIWGNAELIGNVIEHNVAGIDGGGAWIKGVPSVRRNWFRDNEAGGNGGGLFAQSSQGVIWNNLFTENSANQGGGLYLLIVGHSCNGYQFRFNTVRDNTAVVSGGGLYYFHGECWIGWPALAPNLYFNNIIVENQGGGFSSNLTDFDDTFSYNNVWGNQPAEYVDTADLTGLTGNISQDPRFRDAAAEDFRLAPDSPCIDAGCTEDTCNFSPVTVDAQGFPRLLDGDLDDIAIWDMGALEEHGEVEHLRFGSDESTVNWDERVGVVAYHVYRGDLAALRAGGDYTQDPLQYGSAASWCGLPASSLNDPEVPPAGEGIFYLVTPVGAAEGSLGFDSSKTSRPNANPC
jgi:hypothetical protein